MYSVAAQCCPWLLPMALSIIEMRNVFSSLVTVVCPETKNTASI